MKTQVLTLDGQKAGEVELSDDVFGLKPRTDIISRMVYWQQAKRRSGNHKAKIISEVSGTTRKPWKQKGTGRARQGSLRSAQFRKGGIIFGPVVRDHAHDLSRKFRQKALCMALSARLAEGKMLVVDAAAPATHKTKDVVAKLTKLGATNALVIDGANVDPNFAKAVRNLPFVQVLPEQGANVYDILKYDTLVLTKKAVEQLQQRLGKAA